MSEVTIPSPEQVAPWKDIAIMKVTPAFGNPSFVKAIFDNLLRNHPKALILEAYASGTTPRTLNPVIEEWVAQGIPVFLLSSNPGDNHGITKVTYGPQAEAVNAGATPLRNVNINQMNEVASAIQQEINEGRLGTDLAQSITSRYGTPLVPSTSQSSK